jgi:translation elongation factor EF-Ts
MSGNIIGGYVHNRKKAALVSLQGGTIELAKDIAMHIVAIEDEETPLLNQPFIKDGNITIGELLVKSQSTLIKSIRESVD